MEPKCFIIPSRWYKITICRLFWVNLKLILPPPDQQHYHWGVVTILRSKPSPWTRALADPTPSIHKHSWIQRSTLPPPTISFAVPHSEVHTEPDHLVVCHVVCPQATSWGGGGRMTTFIMCGDRSLPQSLFDCPILWGSWWDSPNNRFPVFFSGVALLTATISYFLDCPEKNVFQSCNAN